MLMSISRQLAQVHPSTLKHQAYQVYAQLCSNKIVFKMTFQINLLSAWNCAEDMAAVSHLTL